MNERYLLACDAGRLESAELRKLLATLHGKPFRAVLASLPGYDNAITGRVMDVEEGLAGPRPARAISTRTTPLMLPPPSAACPPTRPT